jgi:hypothetical protein
MLSCNLATMPKRKTSPWPTKIYSYGCRLCSDADRDYIVAQLRLARIYQNKLVEIELRRREGVRAVMAEVGDITTAQADVDRLNNEIETARSTIKRLKAHKDPAARKATLPERKMLATKIEDLIVERKAASLRLKEVKIACKTPALVARFQALGECAKAEVRAARAAIVDQGLYWGTYLLVEKAFEAAAKSKTDPKFRRWDGSGRVGVELMGGLPIAKVMDGDGLHLQIHMRPTGSKRGSTMAEVKIRLGSTGPGGRTPVWVTFPFRLHRPLPADGVIKWAWIHRSFKGRWVNWDLQIVVEAPSFLREPRRVSDGGVAAIDIGWRLRPGNDLRVGYWLDDQGNHGELLMPAEIKQRLDHAESLRSTQDQNFNAAKTNLLKWLETNTLPESLEAAAAYLPLWKSARRLGHLVNEWEKIGDVPCDLIAWWKQHRHLYDWESCERDRAMNKRRDIYRIWAAEFSRKYAVLAIEKFNKSEVAKRSPPEKADRDLPKKARHQRHQTAPSTFVQALKSAAPGNGCKVEELPSPYTTMTCSRCGHVQDFDRKNLFKLCEGCGDDARPIDQDLEAARNLLALWSQNSDRSQK